MPKSRLLYIPFTRMNAGDLYLSFPRDAEHPKGFGADERLLWPDSPPVGDASKPLAWVKAADHTLYINGHGSPGSESLENRNTDRPGAGKPKSVHIDEVVMQLLTLGLTPDTACKIKVWACHSGLDGAGAPSFARRLSAKLHGGLFPKCRVFGYKTETFAAYLLTEDGFHKGAAKEDDYSSRFGGFMVQLEEYGDAPEKAPKDWKAKFNLWKAAKAKSGAVESDQDDADTRSRKLALVKAFVLSQDLYRTGILGPKKESQAKPEVRASSVRAEFKNGAELKS